MHKNGASFIGWRDVAGDYQQGTWSTPDSRNVPVSSLVSAPADRRFGLTNQDDYSLMYNGVAVAVEKRRSNGWQAFGSYTLSKAYGLQPSSGASAAGAQVSTVSPPPPLTFGRDPNDLTNARGRLPNDRPHIFRVMGSVDVPRTGLVIAGNLQHFSGKPGHDDGRELSPCRRGTCACCSSRAVRGVCRRRRCSICASRDRSASAAGRVELLFDILNC